MNNRFIAYVDGYNWYHAIFKHKPEWKWLDVEKFFRTLRPHETLSAVKVFTAIIDEDKPKSDARDRHWRYVLALRSLPKTKVILGKFQDREVTCRVASCRRKYVVPEEKKTDVNIAVEILSDAIDNLADSMAIVSGDSDVQPAVQWVRRRYPDKRVTVYIPALPHEQNQRRLDYYRSIGVACHFLPLSGIDAMQLPDHVKLSSGDVVCRPSTWSKTPLH